MTMRTKISRLVLALTMVLTTVVAEETPHAKDTEGQRTAAMLIKNTQSPGGLILSQPRIVDRLVTEKPLEQKWEKLTLTVTGFLFKVEQIPPGLAGLAAEMSIVFPDGNKKSTVKTDLTGITSGGELRIPAEIVVAINDEGEFTADLKVRDQAGSTLFAGEYSFGYPRYNTSARLKRASTEAFMDDFSTPAMNENLWRIWNTNPGQARFEQKDGRFYIQVTGPIGHNGLVTKSAMNTRDVVLVCRTGLASVTAGEEPHPISVHFCGSGERSADHWFEIYIAGAKACVNAAIPKQYREGKKEGKVSLQFPAPDGYLVKIVSDAATHLCRGYVQLDGQWQQIGDAYEIPARVSNVELKTYYGGRASTTVWFDDCRAYPRPETHYVSVSLKRGDGRSRDGKPSLSGPPPVFFIGDNQKVFDKDIVLKLYAADGATLVDETTVYVGCGMVFFKLEKAPWDIYPVPAIIRVFVKDRQIGPDHVIACQGVEGLYPDDCYILALE